LQGSYRGHGDLSSDQFRFSICGFVKGAAYTNPGVEAFETYTGDFDDAAAAKELTKSFIEKGADVGVGNADHASLGTIEACAEAGVKVVGIIANQNEIAPDHVVGSVEYSYAIAIKGIIQDILDDKFEAKFYNSGFNDGALIFHPNDKVITAEQKAQVEEIISGVADGSIDIGSVD
jgi:basic membrane protein A